MNFDERGGNDILPLDSSLRKRKPASSNEMILNDTPAQQYYNEDRFRKYRNRLMLFLDRILPRSWNPKKESDIPNDTLIRRLFHNFEFRRDRPFRTFAIYFVSCILIIFFVTFLFQFIWSCIPWYVFYKAPLAQIYVHESGTRVATEVYVPSLMNSKTDRARMTAFTAYLEEYRGLLPQIERKHVEEQRFELKNLDPNMYYGLNGVNISFSKLKKDMLEVLKLHDKIHDPHDGKAVCAIEFGIPLNIIMVNQELPGSDPETKTTVFFEPMLTRFPNDDWGLIPVETNIAPVDIAKRWAVETPLRGRIDYMTEAGVFARAVLHQRDLAHIIFCSMLFYDPNVISFDTYWVTSPRHVN